MLAFSSNLCYNVQTIMAAHNFTKEEEVEVFKALATYSITEVAYKFKLDRFYSTPNSLRNAVTAIKNKIKANPANWGVPQTTVDIVENAMRARMVDTPGKTSLAIKNKEKKEIGNVIQDVRDRAWGLIDRKLNLIGKSRKALKEVTLQQLGTIAGIAFDKAQIIRGEATEHIAIKAKIDKDLTPEQLLTTVLQQREQINDINNK